jgi:hypothetical protein
MNGTNEWCGGNSSHTKLVRTSISLGSLIRIPLVHIVVQTNGTISLHSSFRIATCSNETTFSEIYLFNDLLCAQYIFIFNGKGWAESKLAERETERDRKCCYKRVAAWAVNLTVGQIFITARERIIQDVIKMDIKIIFKNLDVFFLKAL